MNSFKGDCLLTSSSNALITGHHHDDMMSVNWQLGGERQGPVVCTNTTTTSTTVYGSAGHTNASSPSRQLLGLTDDPLHHQPHHQRQTSRPDFISPSAAAAAAREASTVHSWPSNDEAGTTVLVMSAQPADCNRLRDEQPHASAAVSINLAPFTRDTTTNYVGQLGRVVKIEDDQELRPYSTSSTTGDKLLSEIEETGCAKVRNGRCRPSTGSNANSSSQHHQQPPQLASNSSPPPPPEQDKKIRREIANSNERRRMMCINNGFVSLQMILPKHYMKRGEKMSKAAVLQSTVDYISKLVMENAKLQSKNDTLAQKIHSARLDSTTESGDEGISVMEQERDQTVSSAKDLVSMVQHWREKYSRERSLRTQAIDEFRRLISDLQYCPAGCSKREIYQAALLRRSKSPTPDNDDDFMGPLSQSEERTLSPSYLTSPPHTSHAAVPGFEKPFSSTSATTVPTTDCGAELPQQPPMAPTKNSKSRSRQSRSSSAVAFTGEDEVEEEAVSKVKPLTGFEILYQAITFSENMDGSKSDSGCSEETFDSNEPPKKRRKTPSSHGNSVIKMERLCS